MNPNFQFVLIDLTTTKTPDSLRPAAHLAEIAVALGEQTVDYGKEYGVPTVSFRIASGPDDRSPAEIAINFRDDLPEAPGALAYHAVTDGIPDIEIGCDLCSSVTGSGESISAATSHEMLELFGDTGANEWADKMDGSGLMGAREVCDPVQNTGYQASNGVWLSNFVRNSYFIPGAPGPWDVLGKMTSQGDFSNGYEVQAGSPTNTTQVGGMRGLAIHHGKPVFVVGAELTETQKKRKSHPWSRTYRRGVRL
jgi:hypothetical protein